MSHEPVPVARLRASRLARSRASAEVARAHRAWDAAELRLARTDACSVHGPTPRDTAACLDAFRAQIAGLDELGAARQAYRELAVVELRDLDRLCVLLLAQKRIPHRLRANLWAVLAMVREEARYVSTLSPESDPLDDATAAVLAMARDCAPGGPLSAAWTFAALLAWLEVQRPAALRVRPARPVHRPPRPPGTTLPTITRHGPPQASRACRAASVGPMRVSGVSP